VKRQGSYPRRSKSSACSRATAGSAYVEILVNIIGAACETHQLAIGVFRDASKEAFAAAIAASLRRYLDEHTCQ
jgi:hypothetical protein